MPGKLVVIDEFHRAPSLFETLRGIIDERVKTRRTSALNETDIEACRRALIGLQDAANLPVDYGGIKPHAGALDARGQPRQGGFDATAELLVHRLFFRAPLGRATQDDRVTSGRV